MIRISFAWFIFFYLLVFLAAIFAVWIGYEMARRNREVKALRHRIRCGICCAEFEDRSSDSSPRCPRCGSITERSTLSSI
jgi:rRNA maturation endonuclease Nob1